MTMDVHSRYRGSSKEEVKPRFVERFFLSLTKSNRFIAMDEGERFFVEERALDERETY